MTTGAAYNIRGNRGSVPLRDSSVDLVIASPLSRRDKNVPVTAYVSDLLAFTTEWARVLKPTGSIWVHMDDTGNNPDLGAVSHADGHLDAVTSTDGSPSGEPRHCLSGIPWRYAIGCIDALGLVLRAEVIETFTATTLSQSNRSGAGHQTWFHFTATQRYFADLDPIREPLVGATGLAANSFYRTNGRADLVPGKTYTQHRTDRPNQPVGDRSLGRVPGSVWRRTTECAGNGHPLAPSSDAITRIIRGWSPADGVVLDPFGSGAVIAAAQTLGRLGVSLDPAKALSSPAHAAVNPQGDHLASAAHQSQPASMAALPKQMELFAPA